MSFCKFYTNLTDILLQNINNITSSGQKRIIYRQKKMGINMNIAIVILITNYSNDSFKGDKWELVEISEDEWELVLLLHNIL